MMEKKYKLLKDISFPGICVEAGLVKEESWWRKHEVFSDGAWFDIYSNDVTWFEEVGQEVKCEALFYIKSLVEDSGQDILLKEPTGVLIKSDSSSWTQEEIDHMNSFWEPTTTGNDTGVPWVHEVKTPLSGDQTISIDNIVLTNVSGQSYRYKGVLVKNDYSAWTVYEQQLVNYILKARSDCDFEKNNTLLQKVKELASS